MRDPKPSSNGFPRVVRRTSILALTGFAIAGALAAYADLQLSVSVVNPASGWGTFLADYGEVPGYLLALAAVSLLLRFVPVRLRELRAASAPTATIRAASRIGLHALWYVLLTVLLVYGATRSAEFLLPAVSTPVLLVTGVLAAAVLIGLWSMEPPGRVRTLVWPARATALYTLLHPLLIVQTIKALWGRTRFRDLAPDLTEFSDWFVPQGITGELSFPSGHAAMGWIFLPLLFWVVARSDGRGGQGRNRAVPLVGWSLGIVFGVAVAASRIVVGAHYLSDVAFSTAVAWALSAWLVQRTTSTTRDSPVTRAVVVRAHQETPE